MIFGAGLIAAKGMALETAITYATPVRLAWWKEMLLTTKHKYHFWSYHPDLVNFLIGGRGGASS